MTKLRKNDHVHKYIRVKLGDKEHIVFKCALPNCPHNLAKDLVEGRLSICWRCNEAFVITKAQINLKRPHCLNCTKYKKVKKEKVVEVKDRLKELIEKRGL